MDLTDKYRIFHPKEAIYTFISKEHVISSNVDHIIGYKIRFNKFKKIQIISSIYSNHNGLKLETKLKEKNQKHSNSWRLNACY